MPYLYAILLLNIAYIQIYIHAYMCIHTNIYKHFAFKNCENMIKYQLIKGHILSPRQALLLYSACTNIREELIKCKWEVLHVFIVETHSSVFAILHKSMCLQAISENIHSIYYNNEILQPLFYYCKLPDQKNNLKTSYTSSLLVSFNFLLSLGCTFFYILHLNHVLIQCDSFAHLTTPFCGTIRIL